MQDWVEIGIDAILTNWAKKIDCNGIEGYW
jgi:hypothetical protein